VGEEVGSVRALTTLILALLIIAVPAAAQEPNGTAVHVPWANKMFSVNHGTAPPTIVHDLGVLKKGKTTTYRIEVTNIYAVPLEMREPIAGSRGLSVKDFTRNLPPHEAGYIVVEIDTSQFDGKKSISLPVSFRGKDPKTNELYFSTAKLEVRANSK
jgi:hypothetical protein